MLPGVASRGEQQKLVGWVVFAFLVLKLLPGLGHALHSLEHVRVEWVLAAVALETLSEFGFVLSWRSIVDPENLLEREGRGRRTATRAAWAGEGEVAPSEHRRRCVDPAALQESGEAGRPAPLNLCFLNTAVDALALILFGLGLATGMFPGARMPLLTLVPAAVAVRWHRGGACDRASHDQTLLAERLSDDHPKVAASISSVAGARAGHEAVPQHPRRDQEPAQRVRPTSGSTRWYSIRRFPRSTPNRCPAWPS